MLVHPLCNQSENQFPAVAVSETETPVQGKLSYILYLFGGGCNHFVLTWYKTEK